MSTGNRKSTPSSSLLRPDPLSECEADFDVEIENVPNRYGGEPELSGAVDRAQTASRDRAKPFLKRVVSFATVNAKFLLTRDLEKIYGLSDLLKMLRYPDLFVITELAKAAGVDANEWLSVAGINSYYDSVWSCRSVSKSGGAADVSRLVGGGVMLLVHRRLRVNISTVFVELPLEDYDLIKGHLAAWRLDPADSSQSGKHGALQTSLIVTAAYVPPEGTDWNKFSNEAIFSALDELERTVLDLRRTQQVDHVVIGHFNAHCSVLPVDLHLRDGTARFDEIGLFCQSEANVNGLRACQRARLDLRNDRERLTVTRVSCEAASVVNKAGSRLIDLMQRHSMCPTSGVVSNCMPTTWVQCGADCAHRVSTHHDDQCPRHSRMVNVNDLVFVDSDLIVDALMSVHPSELLRLVSRRILWADKIDHAVTYGHFRVQSLANIPAADSDSGTGKATAVLKQRRRMRLPDDKHRRLKVQALTGEILHDELKCEPTSSACTRNDIFVEAARKSLASAMLRAPPTSVETGAILTDVELSWSECWKRMWRQRQQLQQLIAQGHTHEQIKVRALNKQLRRLLKQKQSEKRHRCSRSISSSVTTAPKLHWKLLRHNAHDPGEPADMRCKLLKRLNDKDGKLVSTEKNEIRCHLLSHRKQVFSIRSDLSDSALSSMSVDLHLLQAINSAFCDTPEGKQLGATAVLRSRCEPAIASASGQSMWCGQQPLPSAPPDLPVQTKAAVAKIGVLRKSLSHQPLCQNLESLFRLDELEAVLTSLDDTGPGIDGVAVGSLTNLHDETRNWLLDLLNEIWISGVHPKSWSDIRVVLHYKGKGSDPYCADNYRGLGIGAALEKILSLIMMKRLEQFLLETGSLHLSQGGFLPQRGPPEQVFTLSEAVRAELKRGAASAEPIHLCFIDIERAYDSVQHIKLWATCAKLGIGGRFLSTLQTMYANKKAILDVDGELLDPHDVQCGVLQGNPLSPLLFNIYINDILRELDVFASQLGSMRDASDSDPLARLDLGGIPLPFFDADGKLIPPTGGQLARLSSLFFADDGVLITRSRLAMQALLDHLAHLLETVGLSLNAKKTKVMVIPPLSSTDKAYISLKSDIVSAGGYMACGRSIEIVNDFMYLGFRIWYHWDWTKAWQTARLRARRMLYSLRQAGMQNQSIPLVYQLRFAASQVLSHLDYISAIAGVEGGGDGELVKNDMLVDQLLRLVTGVAPNACGEALKAEAGVWNTETRVRMLQLRFFTKLTMMDHSSTHFRAMCLSRCSSDMKRHKGASRYYTWFDGVYSSASYFDFPVHNPGRYDDVLHLSFTTEHLCPMMTLVRIERLNLLDVWEAVDEATPNVPNQQLRVRAAHNGVYRFDYSTGNAVSEWLFPPRTTIASAWSVWSENLCEAAFAELRFRGNSLRQVFFRDTLSGWSDPSSGLRDFAPLKEASYLEPYWFTDDPHAARCILRARIGCSKLEFDYRRAPHHYPRASSHHQLQVGVDPSKPLVCVESSVACSRDTRQTRMARLGVPHHRACYLCPVSEWMPETVHHVLLSCPDDDLVVERRRVREALSELLRSVEKLPAIADVAVPPSPNLDDQCALYFILMLATSVGPSDHLPSDSESAPDAASSDCTASAADNAIRRSRRLAIKKAAAVKNSLGVLALDQRREQLAALVVNRPSALSAVGWTAFLTSHWRRAIAQELEDDPFAIAGARLVDIVVNHHRRVIGLRRRTLQLSSEFLHRGRDPLQPKPVGKALPSESARVSAERGRNRIGQGNDTSQSAEPAT